MKGMMCTNSGCIIKHCCKRFVDDTKSAKALTIGKFELSPQGFCYGFDSKGMREHREALSITQGMGKTVPSAEAKKPVNVGVETEKTVDAKGGKRKKREE